MMGLSRLSIQSKMILILLAVSLASIALMGWIGYVSGESAIRQSVENQLQGMQVSKSTTLRTRLESLRDQVISMSDSRIAIDGVKLFTEAFREIESKSVSKAESDRLTRFYQEDFLPELAKRVDGKPVLENYFPGSPVAQYLQHHYIASNPHPYEKKQLLDDAVEDQSGYRSLHSELHKKFTRAVQIFGFEDLLLIDANSLNVVYSYLKTTEFATNLEDGPYSNTKLGTAVRAMRLAKDRDSFKIADFESYRPSLGKYMAFVMSPIFDGPKMVGILVLQFPVDGFNQVLTGNFQWVQEGLGETGECYAVGPDKTMRSRGRFMYQDSDAFLNALRENGLSPNICDQIDRQGSTIGVLPVTTESVELALRGKSGIREVVDARGERVLSAYGPIELDSLRWAVLAEKDIDEAYAPIREFGRKVIIVASGMALLVSLLAIACSSLLTRPLRLLTEGAKRLGAGDTGVRVNIKSKDEFGELGRVFNEMADSIKSQTSKLEDQVRENQELLLSILPASAVEQRKEGDERASRQFSDVSVLFAELIGLEEFSGGVGETKALSVLGDLIAAFDEAAEKHGIEKVKTIGGAYLAVCGLSVNRPDHVRRIIQFAQEITRIVSMFNREYRAELNILVGINSGPVVGGVVGRRKFLYDLWGDTVTIAKKLAAGSVDSQIRVTSNVRERLGDQVSFEGPFRIEVSGKPPIDAWRVNA